METRYNIAGLPEFLREKQIIDILPISHSTLWRWCKSGHFPAPIRLGPRVTAWRKDDVVGFLQTANMIEE